MGVDADRTRRTRRHVGWANRAGQGTVWGSELELIGDAADFDDQALLALADAAPDPQTVGVYRLYQFAADIEPVRLIVDFTAAVIHGVPVSMLSDWLTEVINTLRDTAARLARHPVLDVRYRRSSDGDVGLEARLWDIDDLDTDAAVDRVITLIESVHSDRGRPERRGTE